MRAGGDIRFLDYFSRKTCPPEELQAFREFLFSVSTEELESLSDKLIEGQHRETYPSVDTTLSLPPTYLYDHTATDFVTQLYLFFVKRHLEAHARRIRNLPGPQAHGRRVRHGLFPGAVLLDGRREKGRHAVIKLGCMSLSYGHAISEGRMDLFDFIDRAREMGLDGIDIHTRALESEDDAYLRDVRMRCMQRGLAISYLGISNNFGKPPGEIAAEIKMVKHWIDVAARLNVPLVRIFAAWDREDTPARVTWSRMIYGISEVVDHGAARGVAVGLHNHNHGCVTRTGDDVVRILNQVDRPTFTHILDTGQYAGSPGASGSRGNPDPAYDFYGSMEKSAPYAAHVRAKFYRIQSGEEEWLDYPRILGILKQVGFNGWMSVVYEGQDVEAEEIAVPKAVAYLRRLLAENGM